MAMKFLRDGAKGGLGKFILVGFMALAVGGLVLMDMGGFFRGGGVTQTDVARAGNDTISANRFDRAVRRTLTPLGLTPQQAYQMGYMDQILKMEIRASLINQSAKDLGILISDQYVAEHIKKLVTPIMAPGDNPKQVLERILFNQGMSEGEFVNAIKSDMASSVLTSALQSGFAYVDDRMARHLYNHKNESRTVEYIMLPDSAIDAATPPSDDELEAMYNINREAYAIPETRHFQVITLDQDKMKSAVDISEAVLRQNYDDNIDFYAINATWVLEQALVSDKDKAQTIANSLQKGQALKPAVIDVTGNENAYLGEKSFENIDLPEDIKDEVLTAQKSDTLGPIESPLGWYVINVKSADPARTKSFEEVKDDIKKDLLETQLADQLYEHANMIDDLLAGGASLEDLKEETDVKIIDLPAVNAYGRTADGKNPLKDDQDLRLRIIEDGFSFSEGETTPVQETSDGRFMAIHVREVSEKSYTPFSDIKTDLLDNWTNDQRRIANKTKAYSLAEAVKSTSLADVAKQEKTPLKTIRRLERNGDLPSEFLAKAKNDVFASLPGVPQVLDTENGLALAVVTAAHWPKDINEDELETLKSDLTITQQNEAITLYLGGKQKELGTKVNRTLIDRMYAGRDN